MRNYLILLNHKGEVIKLASSIFIFTLDALNRQISETVDFNILVMVSLSARL